MKLIIKKISLYSALIFLSSNALAQGYSCTWEARPTGIFVSGSAPHDTISGKGPVRSTIENAMSAANATCEKKLRSMGSKGNEYGCSPVSDYCEPVFD